MSLPASGSLSSWHQTCSLLLIERQVGPFLSLGAEVQEHMCGEVDLFNWAGSTGPQDFLADDPVMQWMVVGSASVFDGPIGTDEARIEQGGKPSAQQRLLLRRPPGRGGPRGPRSAVRARR